MLSRPRITSSVEARRSLATWIQAKPGWAHTGPALLAAAVLRKMLGKSRPAASHSPNHDHGRGLTSRTLYLPSRASNLNSTSTKPSNPVADSSFLASAVMSGLETVSTSVLVKPNSMGYWRLRRAVISATGALSRHKPAYENWASPPPGMNS